jgi:sugar O-acyltransferase (sialic acid O-acetyltransferase NeuD family)
MSMKEIAIFGAGGQGRETLQLIRQINEVENAWHCIGWFDDGIPSGALLAGKPVLGGLQSLNQWERPLSVVIAIGWPAIKQKVVTQIFNPLIRFPTLIHPDVLIEGEEIQIGEGSIITRGCHLTVNIHIGKHVLLNIGTTLTHDCQIGDYCGLMPAVNISGEVVVEEGCYLGTGAKIIQQKRIGKNSIIGAGAVVINDIPPGSTAVGVPARIIKSD